ncbi:MAG: hypothetical protein CMN30_21760 [Sandaracinus sp.]|nr:hypothetical protein [Sandaracinus sp.]|tara:strand:- start:394 stop:1089 length:696 start_codon:yes stop_codon:yes gene_type:complete
MDVVAVASLCLGITSFFFMLLGMIFSMVPVVGAVLSFGAPVLALSGIVLGGLSISRANQTGEPSGMGTAGTAVSAVGFLISLVFALTCGLCNACFSTAMMDGSNGTGGLFGPGSGMSGGPNQPGGPTQPGNSGAGSPGLPGFFPQPQQPSGAQGQTPPPLPTNFAPATTCDDVRPCCLAFTHDDPTICDGVLASARQQADPTAACRELAAGWASGLEQLGEAVPASCRPAP